MINLMLLLAGIFLATFSIGKLFERARIPWIFASLFIGMGLAAYNPFVDITSEPSFVFLAELGMYFLLFLIGYDLNARGIFRQRRFVFTTAVALIISETILGTLVLRFLFTTPWAIAIVVSSSFATVGEAILLPILSEFNLANKKLGQAILGIGVLDDIIEVFTITAAVIIIGRFAGYPHINIWTNLLALASLFGLLYVMVAPHKRVHRFQFHDIPSFFLFVLFIILLFIGIGDYVESSALGALLSGIALKNVVPKNRIRFVEREIKTMSFGFFAPVFFVWVGLNPDYGAIIDNFLLVIVLVLVIAVAKMGVGYLMGRTQFSKKESLILGTSLMVKMSTSIVVIKLLFEKGMIAANLYSVLIATTAIFSFIVPILLVRIIERAGIGVRS